MDRMGKNFGSAFSRLRLVPAFLLFVLFFAIKRLAGNILLSSQLHWLPQRPVWIELLSSLGAAAILAAILLYLRGLWEDSVTARKEHAKFMAAVESSLDDFYIFDGIADASGEIADFRFSYINPNAERRLNVRRESLLGKVLTEERPYMISSGLIEKYREVVRTGVPLTCEIFMDDERIKDTWLSIQVVKLGDGVAITSRDITESKRMADHVQYLAHYDPLTGLANRALLADRLHQAVLRARRYRHQVALFVVDVDHFKQINDSFGHASGDTLLTAIGERLVSSVRETDTVARMGGDEFVIIMPDFKSMEDVKRCGLQIVKKAAEAIMIEDREIHITISVGVCTFPDYAQNTKDLFKNADAAMYLVKEAGRNGLHVFDENMVRAGEERSELGEDEYR
jgi:diguanylate cyclase (GGDEF)-like protein